MASSRRASIVINNYDYGRFLGEAVESALAQTYGNVEVIVVDDGSTDESREIIRSYGKSVVPVLKENGGQASAFNAGFAVATGEVILFLDADDALLPEAVAAVMPAFDDPCVSKVHWPLRIIDASGEADGKLLPPEPLPEGDPREDVLLHGPDSYLSSPCSGNAWSREMLEQLLPMPEPPYRKGADGYLITLAPLFGRIARSETPLGSYRIHGANQFWKRSLEERIAGSLERYDRRADSLAAFLRSRGESPDPDLWRQRNSYYQWMRRVSQAIQELKSVLPSGSRFVLVDEDQWGNHFLKDSRSTPFLEREGEYWGPPPNDETAVSELERLRRAGHEYLVLGWPCFWWLDHYRRFAEYLSGSCRSLHESERVKVFQLCASA